MRTVRDGDAAGPLSPSVVAMGVFDGLHRGHQAVIAQLRALAERYGAPATVVTFDPLPQRSWRRTARRGCSRRSTSDSRGSRSSGWTRFAC